MMPDVKLSTKSGEQIERWRDYSWLNGWVTMLPIHSEEIRYNCGQYIYGRVHNKTA